MLIQSNSPAEAWIRGLAGVRRGRMLCGARVGVAVRGVPLKAKRGKRVRSWLRRLPIPSRFLDYGWLQGSSPLAPHLAFNALAGGLRYTQARRC